MADTLAANVTELSQQLVDATVMQMPQVAPLMNLVERIDIPTGRNSVEIPRAASTFSVQTPTEGDDIVESSQFDLTSTSIAPTLRAINIRVSERARYFSQQDTLRLISQELARAQGQDVDTDISAEFANFGQSAGVTNTDLTISTLREARRKLQANAVANGGPAPDPIYTVLAPIPVENLMTNLGLQGVVPTSSAGGQQFVSEGLSEEFIRQYFVDGINLVGVGTFWDGYLTEDGSGDFICSMHSRSALQLAMSKDWDMRQFEESEWIGVIIRSVADYNSGVGKFPNWGVKITADGA